MWYDGYMPRPLRIQYQNAVYHVMNRGQSRREVFCSDEHYKKFLSLLKDCAERWQVEIHAFSLMPNHYHLLLQTPHGNLSRVMRHIDGLYTQWFNRLNDRDGALFRGRYKAILVDEDAYLVELLRYIHRNPVKAGLVAEPEQHKWSGHQGYVKNLNNLKWLTTHRLMGYFGKTEREARKKLREFMNEKVPTNLEKRLESKKWPSTFSTKMFQELVEWNFVSDLKNKNIHYEPYIPIKITERHVRTAICQTFECKWQQVAQPRGRQQKLFRAISLALYSRKLGWTYKQILKRFPDVHETTVSKAIQRAPRADPEMWIKVNRQLHAGS